MNHFASIEDKLGYPLPESCKSFLLATDNKKYVGKVFDRVFEDGWSSNSIIESIVTIDSFWEYNKYREYIDEMQAHFENPVSYVESEYLYAIIHAVNMAICMALNGRHKGKIYCVDNGDFGIMYQAENLEEFLQSLTDYEHKTS